MSDETILTVDDEPAVLNALHRALRSEGYRLLRATSGDEALEVLARDNVDMVISDHLMPGMSGLDLLRRVRLLYPRVMRVVVTGHATVDMAIQAINLGEIYRFLTKPWDDAELKLTLRLAFESRRLRQENRRLTQELDAQKRITQVLENRFPGISKVDRSESGAVVIPDDVVREVEGE